MTGEDPLKVWQRLRSTKQWRVGPLAPDAWSGCVFVADDADIFAFRTLSLPQAWLHGSPQGNRAEYCGKQFEAWFSKWAEWWKQVGPKAPDNTWARLVWQMPEGGPEVTYEWAHTAKNEVVGR